MQRSAPHIPDHEIIRKIGSGAYGEVWLARAITGAWRAIKIVRRDDFDDDRSFQREFEGIRHYEPIARNHPGLVHILHVGSNNEPAPFYYYVMELGDDVDDGSDINPNSYKPRTIQTDKKLSTGVPLPVDYVLEIGIQLSGALSYLHSKDLTHRDIKPANIIFVNNRPKLADVGLVAQRDQHTFVGTEGFIPHEGPGTKRADVFALGKVLYELATGKDRLDFPELPDEFPDDFDRVRWLELNKIICACCEPDVQKCHLNSAATLHHALKDVKRGKAFRKPNCGPLSSPGRMFAALTIVALAFTLMMGGLYLYRKNNPIDSQPQQPINNPGTGTLQINSFPQGAAIYDRHGKFIDETPYGPIALPVGTEVIYVLKKEGYRDLVDTGVIRADKLLGIGGEMVLLAPPVKGQPWQDSEGRTYMPHEKEHLSETPIATASIENFLSNTKKTDRTPFYFTTKLPNSEELASYALISPSDAIEYAEWLTEISFAAGHLVDNQAISPIPIEQWNDWQLTEEQKEKNLSAYLLRVGEVDYVKAHITSNPEGAAVTFNGANIGKTPIQWTKLSPGQYTFTFKLPGYERHEAKGTIEENKDLRLHVNLIKDGSVEFNREWKNSLGMSFSPLSSLLSVSKYPTRNSEFNAYLIESNLPPVKAPDFSQTPEHPVVNVTREQARMFANWLTQKEKDAGILESTDYYRLPTDKEWTAFAGGTPEEGKYPSDRNTSGLSPELNEESAPDLFPWGNLWPPPADIGNFADKTAKKSRGDRIISGYSDGYPNTSPVGSFKPNRLGLYDVSGNVWEWIDDDYGGSSDFKFKDYEVARGGSWCTYRAQQLLTRYRNPLPPNTISYDLGFRLVLVRQQYIPETDNNIPPDPTTPAPVSNPQPDSIDSGVTPVPSIKPTSTTKSSKNGQH